MTHIDDYESLVIRYADDELDDSERQTFEAHLKGCGACTDLLEEHRESLRFVQTAFSNPPVAEPLAPERVTQRAKRRGRRMGYAVAIASGLVILAAAVFGAVRTGQTEPPLLTNDEMEFDASTEILELRIALLEAQLAEMRAELDESVALVGLDDRMAYYEFASIAVAAAQHLEETGLDYEGARERYRFVADRYPDSPAAATANERLSAMSVTSSTT